MFFAKRVVIASLGQKLFVISLDQQIFYSLKRSFKHMGFYGDFQGELQLFRYIRYFVINRFVITRFKCSRAGGTELKQFSLSLLVVFAIGFAPCVFCESL